MINLLMILIIELVFLYINYLYHKRDFFEPSVITCASLVCGTVFSFIGYDLYGSHISTTTVAAILIGLVTISLGSFCAKKEVSLSKLKYGHDYRIIHERVKIITITTILLTILYGVDAYRVGMQNGGSGLNAFAYMKHAYTQDGENQKMNLLIRQGFKFVQASGYLNIYYLIRSLVYRQNIQLRKMNTICILCSVMIVIFSGSRTEISRLLFAGLLCYSVVFRECKGWSKNGNDNRKMVKKIIPLGALSAFILFVTRSVVKTSEVELSNTKSATTYFSFYFGSPVFVLNQKLSHTCFSLKDFLVGSESGKDLFGQHVYLGDFNYGGNTSTLFELVISNGILGLIGYYFVRYLAICIIYQSVVVDSLPNHNRDLLLLIFSMLYFAPAFAFYADCFNMATNFTSVLTIVIMIALYKFTTHKVERKVEENESCSVLSSTVSRNP